MSFELKLKAVIQEDFLEMKDLHLHTKRAHWVPWKLMLNHQL